MEICCWKTSVPLISVPTSILLVHLKDIKWPIAGKLANPSISKVTFLRQIGQDCFLNILHIPQDWRMEPFCSRTSLGKPDAAAFSETGSKKLPWPLGWWLSYPLFIKALVWKVCTFRKLNSILHLCLTWTHTVLH